MDEELKFQQMQDEMSRFEAEISGDRSNRTVIGSATYGAVQQRLSQGGSHSLAGPLLPPPAAPFLSGNDSGSNNSFLLPTQLQRSHLAAPTSLSQFPVQNTGYVQALPQPVVLSGAPQLYKKKGEGSDDEIEIDPNLPHVMPSLTPTILDIPVPHPPPAPYVPPHKPSKKEKKNRKIIRTGGGQTWEDLSLLDWPDDDFRLFCGDLGNDVTDELLIRTFSKYSSFCRAKVIRDKRTNKSKGFGFISFREPADFIKAMKEMNGRYVGSRPIKLRKSTWRNRSLDVVRKKEKEKAALISMLTGGANKS